MQNYNTVIVGSGPLGLACGIEAVKNNLSHIILEKGCLTNSIYNYPINMTFFSTSEKIELEGVPFVSHGDKPTRREALEYYRKAAMHYKLNVSTFNKVLEINKTDSGFQVVAENDTYNCQNVILATGFYDNPTLLGVEGEQLSKVTHYFNEAHPYAFKKIAVIGGGNSGVDAALEAFRKGADVTMIIWEPDFKENVKYWVKPDIENRIKEGSIKAYFNARVLKIDEKSILIQTNEGIINLENDFVLAMTGYHSDFNFLTKIGVQVTEGQPVFNQETLETNVEGLYLAGVVCCGVFSSKYFIENTLTHPKQIISSIINNKNKIIV